MSAPTVTASTPIDELPLLLTPGEVSAVLRVDAKTVTRWAKTGKLTAAVTTPGGHRRYARADILPFLTGGAR